MEINRSIKKLCEYSRNHQLRTLITTICASAFILLLRNLYIGFETRIRAGYLDTAGMLDLIKPGNAMAPFRSDYLAASYGGTLKLIGATNEAVCSVALNINTSGYSNIFHDHAYLISWPLSVLNFILPFSSLQIVAASYLVSYVSVFVTTYIFLSKVGARFIVKASTLFAIATYPVFVVAFTGQPFFDHLMIGFAVPLILIIWWTKYRSRNVYKWAVLLTVLLSMTTERGAALASLISVGYLVLLHGTRSLKVKELRIILFSGLISSIWFIIWIKYFQSYVAYGQISLSGMVSRFNSLFQAPLSNSAFVFFSTSVFWMVLNIFSGRLAFVSLFAMSPNLLVSIGGAELTGFLTHYHQAYTAVLVAGGVIGVTHYESHINKIGDSIVRKHILSICCITLLIASAFVYKISSVQMASGKAWTSIEQIWLPGSSSAQKSAEYKAEFLGKSLLEISTYKEAAVSAPEIYSPTMLINGFKNYEYWPTAVGQAKIVIAPFAQGTPTVFPFGDFYGTGDTLTKCISDELERSYTLLKVVYDNLLGEYRFYLKK